MLSTYVPRLTVVKLPQALGYAGAAVIEPLLSGRQRPTLYSTGTVTGFDLDLPIDSEQTWDELGIAAAYPTIAEGVPATLDGYVHFLWRHPAWDHRRS